MAAGRRDEVKGKLLVFAIVLGRRPLLARHHKQIGNLPVIECIRQAYRAPLSRTLDNNVKMG
jgi:hypothetical protein